MLLTVEGQTQPIEEWALDYGIPCDLIRSRLERGWSEERAVTEPMELHGKRRLSDAEIEDIKARARAAAQPVVIAPRNAPPRFKITVAKGRRAKPIAFAGKSTRCDGDSDGASKRPRGQALVHDGKTMRVNEWAEYLGLHKQVIHYRLRQGWPLSRVLDRRRCTGRSPGLKPKLVEFNGEALTVKQWATRLGIDKARLYYRLQHPDWTIERARTPGTARRQTKGG